MFGLLEPHISWLQTFFAANQSFNINFIVKVYLAKLDFLQLNNGILAVHVQRHSDEIVLL
jgi:hypothetical protein